MERRGTGAGKGTRVCSLHVITRKFTWSLSQIHIFYCTCSKKAKNKEATQ